MRKQKSYDYLDYETVDGHCRVFLPEAYSSEAIQNLIDGLREELAELEGLKARLNELEAEFEQGGVTAAQPDGEKDEDEQKRLEIERYTQDGGDDLMYPCSDGEWVYFEDAQEALTAATAPLQERLRGQRKEMIQIHSKAMSEIEQILGKAFGYPEAYPHVSEVDDGSVVVAPELPVDLADRAVRVIAHLESERDRLKTQVEELTPPPCPVCETDGPEDRDATCRECLIGSLDSVEDLLRERDERIALFEKSVEELNAKWLAADAKANRLEDALGKIRNSPIGLGDSADHLCSRDMSAIAKRALADSRAGETEGKTPGENE